MAYNFPNSPALNEVFLDYKWDGEKWILALGGISGFVPPDVWQTTYFRALNTQNSGFNGYNMRQVTVPAELLLSGSKVRVTFEASTSMGGFIIDAAAIGHAAVSGDAYDFNGSQVPLTFSGGSAGTTIAQGTTVTSDAVTFALDKTKPFIVAVHLNSAPPGGVRSSGVGASLSYYKGAANDVLVSDVSGYSGPTGSPYLVRLIEVVV